MRMTEDAIYSVLVVSAAETFNESLTPLLPAARFSPLSRVKTADEARRILADRTYDLILIHAPLPDESGLRFAQDAGERCAAVLLFVRGDAYPAVWEKMAQSGVFTLPRPTSRQTVGQALDWLIAAAERGRMTERAAVSLEERMREIRTVNRAKWLLISESGMSEAEAHRWIEKRAMDECRTKREIAEEILAKGDTGAHA